MYSHINAELQIEYGKPLERSNSQGQTASTDEKTDVDLPLAQFAVIGMGKFGGRELNFSADLDLMLVYSAEGETTQGTPNADYFSRLGLELVNRMKGNTGGGGIYELDLRLRPFGSGGSIALSLEGYQNYYEKDAETWERQALIRARPVAGDIQLGQEFIKQAHAFAYGQPLTAEQTTHIIHNRQRKEAQTTRSAFTSATSRRRRRRRKQQIDVKSGYGGLIDIEFVAQTLQLMHGMTHPQVRVQNTVEAIHRLYEVAALTRDQREQLLLAYEFLRNVENSLRIVHDRPLDALPDKTPELEQLAKRLGYEDGTQRFLKDYHWCTETTRTLFNQLLNTQ
jgi:glutamate-ammonia-ligase adenylyltransferase